MVYRKVKILKRLEGFYKAPRRVLPVRKIFMKRLVDIISAIGEMILLSIITLVAIILEQTWGRFSAWVERCEESKPKHSDPYPPNEHFLKYKPWPGDKEKNG